MSLKPAEERFEAIVAPDERWMIFDQLTGMPAERNGLVLIGLERGTAFSILRYLNGTDMPLKNGPRSGTNKKPPANVSGGG
jgi:hypothetical protein